jgi:hypothetical protein
MGGFHSFKDSDEASDFQDQMEYTFEDKSRPLKTSTKIPKTSKRVDGSNPFGKEQSKNPSQTRGKKTGLKTSMTPTPELHKQINTTAFTGNTGKARKPDTGWSDDPNAKTAKSGDGESPSKAKKDKGAAAPNSVPRARQRRQPIGRNRN